MHTQTKHENREIPYFQGISSARAQRQSGVGRKEMADLVARFQESVVKKVGSVFVSAQIVLEFLHEAGHLKHVTKSNGLGDVLGAKHFNLPYAPHAGKRRYLLPAITWDKETRSAFFALSPDEKVAKVRALEKELLGIDYEAFQKDVAEAIRAVNELPEEDFED